MINALACDCKNRALFFPETIVSIAQLWIRNDPPIKEVGMPFCKNHDGCGLGLIFDSCGCNKNVNVDCNMYGHSDTAAQKDLHVSPDLGTTNE